MLLPELSVLAVYVIRKLISRQANHLKSVVVAGAGIDIHAETDLSQVLTELYQEPAEITCQIYALEALVRRYQQLERKEKDLNQSSQMHEVEKEILWIFGLKIQSPTLALPKPKSIKKPAISEDPAETAAAIVRSRLIKSRFVPLVTQSSWIEALCPSETNLSQGKNSRNNSSIIRRN
jgi:hypothetical protein